MSIRRRAARTRTSKISAIGLCLAGVAWSAAAGAQSPEVPAAPGTATAGTTAPPPAEAPTQPAAAAPMQPAPAPMQPAPAPMQPAPPPMQPAPPPMQPAPPPMQPAPPPVQPAPPPVQPAAVSTAPPAAAPVVPPFAMPVRRGPAYGPPMIDVPPAESFTGKIATGSVLLLVGSGLMIPSALAFSSCENTYLEDACFSIAGLAIASAAGHIATGAVLLGVGLHAKQRASDPARSALPAVRAGLRGVEATWQF